MLRPVYWPCYPRYTAPWMCDVERTALSCRVSVVSVFSGCSLFRVIVDGVTHSPAGRLLLQLRISARSWYAIADREEFDVRSHKSFCWLGPVSGHGNPNNDSFSRLLFKEEICEKHTIKKYTIKTEEEKKINRLQLLQVVFGTDFCTWFSHAPAKKKVIQKDHLAWS